MPTSNFSRLLSGLVLLLTSLLCHGQIVALDPVIQGQALGSHLYYWIDHSDSAKLDTVRQQPHWQLSNEAVPNFGLTRKVYWFRLEMQAATLSEPWLLQLEYNLLDDVRFYLLDDSGNLLAHKQTGMAFSDVSAKGFQRTFLLPLPIDRAGIVTAYIRVHSDHALHLPLYLWKSSAFVAEDEQVNILLGLFFGTFGVLLLYNFFQFTLTRDSLYLVYSGLVLALIAFHAQLRGVGLRMIWPEWVQWNGPFFLLTSSMATYMLALHAERFLRLPQSHFPLRKAFTQLRWLCLVTGLVLPWSRTEFGIYLLITLASLVAVITFLAVLYCYRRDDRPIRWFAIAWSLFFLGILSLAGNKVAILPYNVITDHALSLGALVGMLLISMAMSDRNNQIVQTQLQTIEKKRHQIELEIEQKARLLHSEEMERNATDISLRLQTEGNERLLQEMDQREDEIKQISQQLRDATRIDSQTMLNNRSAFNIRINEEFERAIRSRQRLSVVLVAISAMDTIVQRYGFRAADEVLRQSAERVDSVTRLHCASAYRYEEDMFSVLMPAISESRMQAVVGMIQNAFEQPPFLFAGQTLEVNATLGAASLIPDVGLRPEALMSSAEQALATARDQQSGSISVNTGKAG